MNKTEEGGEIINRRKQVDGTGREKNKGEKNRQNNREEGEEKDIVKGEKKRKKH